MAGVNRPVSRGQTRQPASPAGRPFVNSLTQVGPQGTPYQDEVTHSACTVEPSKPSGTGVPNVGSVPSTPKKGTLKDITPKRGRGR
jgi:hypothetical protein